ncbi:MAG TPA: MqnA/MqnD/SBP family protein, partial [bacterium]|nr:MqnA/MqnD/SBP family protein [bacterium]
MTHFRLGVVPYVNAMPLWVPLERGQVATQHTFSFHKAVPDRLARDLLNGTVDLALLSVVEALKNRRLKIVDGVCISSFGPVETVQLFHRRPLDQCARIALDRDSRTSSALARILLEQRFSLPGRSYETARVDLAGLPLSERGIPATGPGPTTVAALSPMARADAVEAGELDPAGLEAPPGGPVHGGAGTSRIGLSTPADLGVFDAFLSIGDKTWDFLKTAWDHTDLGDLWTDTTGLPMVWAAWIAGETVQDREIPKVLARTYDASKGSMDDIIRRLSRAGTG